MKENKNSHVIFHLHNCKEKTYIFRHTNHPSNYEKNKEKSPRHVHLSIIEKIRKLPRHVHLSM